MPALKSTWQDVTTLQDVCRCYRPQVKHLLAQLDLSRPELAAVGRAAAADNELEACRALLEHFRQGEDGHWLRAEPPEPGTGTEEVADRYVAGEFNKKEFWHVLPRDAEGHVRWDFVPNEGGVQFRCNLNRHQNLSEFFKAYRGTGHPKYAEALDAYFRDWLTAADGRPLPFGGPMEIALRLPVWASIFFGTIRDAKISDALRILMLSQVPGQAETLLERPLENNGRTMVIRALLQAAVCWPQFTGARAWERIATDWLIEAVDTLIYPDGAATELTATYHGVTRGMIDAATSVLRRAGRELPPAGRSKARGGVRLLPAAASARHRSAAEQRHRPRPSPRGRSPALGPLRPPRLAVHRHAGGGGRATA